MTDPISRLNAALEGRYRIEREAGIGGMATVYLAQDLRHGRTVALKVLKPELAAVVGAERFLAEIKTTANLTHPHILPLHDSGEADGFLFFVMPYIQGDTLRDRIDREKQLGVDEALRITTKVAAALEYAHKQGVVHRDIKPGNILLSAEGEPTVADFGIALAVAQAGGGRVTETGLSVGTPHYMSPEQATGDQDVDPRTDVYALGCVLYEMLVGEPPYTGVTAQAILGKIIQGKPVSVIESRPSVPPNVDAAIRKALEKLPADRFRSAGEFAAALTEPAYRWGASTGEAASAAMGAAAGGRPRSGLVGALVLATVVASGLAAWGWLRPSPSPPAGAVLRFRPTDFDLDPRGGSPSFAISADGSMIASRRIGAGDALWVRRSNETEWRAIAGTVGASEPQFSPDGRWLAFRSGSLIQRVETGGGPVLPIGEPAVNFHWGPGDRVVFVNTLGELFIVGAFGGEPELLAGPDPVVAGPFLLPDGEAILFQNGLDPTARLMVLEIGSREMTDLGVLGRDPTYVPTGHLLFERAGALMAVPFDVARREVTGEAFTAIAVLPVSQAHGEVKFGVSENGIAIYGLGNLGAENRLIEMALDGTTDTIPLGAGNFRHPRYSPDGRYLAYELAQDVWIYDRETGSNEPFTDGGGAFPTWSSDGRIIYYASPSGVPTRVLRRPADGSAEAEELVSNPPGGFVFPQSSAPSGSEWIMGEWSGNERGMNLVRVTEEGGRMAVAPYLRGDWNELMGQISPDGRWAVYLSNESGMGEVYMRTFPEGTGRLQISDLGGPPRWSPDGRSVYYMEAGSLRRASIAFGASPTVTSREVIFATTSYFASDAIFGAANFDIHPDGRRLVMVVNVGPGEDLSTRTLPIEIVVNWFTELKRLGGP